MRSSRHAPRRHNLQRDAFGHRFGFEETSPWATPTICGFRVAPDGSQPTAGLVDVTGVLYGSTQKGGTSTYNGTVFAVTPGGFEKVLHGFTGSPDGEQPDVALITVGGTLYGTTEYGGTANQGTVFSMKPSGKETVLYSFQGGSDGAQPYWPTLYFNGALYGTTAYGGTGGGGTVFEIPLTGAQDTILYNFKGGTDGSGPRAGLIYYKGALYGTTFSGGASNDGTVFKVTLSGTETVLHPFAGYPSDGWEPACDLVRIGDKFFGTTDIGGSSYYNGTVFKVTSSGQETVRYNFGTSAGLVDPNAGLIDVNGTLFGTSTQGGGGGNPGGYGLGAVFAVSL